MSQNCCNPFNLHSRTKRYSVSIVSKKCLKQARKLNIILSETDQMCVKCKIKLATASEAVTIPVQEETEPTPSTSTSAVREYQQSSESTSSGEESATIIDLDSAKSLKHLNTSLVCLGETPIDKRNLRSQKYKKAKLQEVVNTITSKIFGEQDAEESNKEDKSAAEIIDQLKAKMKNTLNNAEKYLILTTLPKSWTIRQIQTEFNVSYYMARRSKQLVNQRGVMVTPLQKLGSRHIEDDIVQLIKEFYCDDDNSRVCAGKREYVNQHEW